MDIEKEIKQKVRFSSEYQKLTVNILYTASWLGIKHMHNLKPFALTTQQYNLLRILRGQFPKPATVNMLIDRMIDKSSNASRLVDRLIQKGLVNRQICETDKRSVDVIITEKGLELLKKIDDQMKNFEDDLKTITREEAKEINRLLDKLRG